MNVNFGLILESLVAVLLATTIFYCFILNKRLTGLRADEQLMRQTIRDLTISIDTAERAIEHLRKTAGEQEHSLQNAIESAERTQFALKDSQVEALDTLSALRHGTSAAHDTTIQIKALIHTATTMIETRQNSTQRMTEPQHPTHYTAPKVDIAGGDDTHALVHAAISAVTTARKPFSAILRDAA